MNLSDYTTEQLKSEITRRQMEIDRKNAVTRFAENLYETIRDAVESSITYGMDDELDDALSEFCRRVAEMEVRNGDH